MTPVYPVFRAYLSDFLLKFSCWPRTLRTSQKLTTWHKNEWMDCGNDGRRWM